MDGSAPHPYRGLRIVGKRPGRRAPRDVALLAGAAAARQDRHLLRLLVHRPDRASCRRHAEAYRFRAPAGDHPPLRAHAGGRGRAGAEALVSPVEVRTEEKAARTERGSADRVAGHSGRMETPRQIRALREGRRGGPARDQHGRGAVAGDRRLRRTLSRAHGRPRGARCAAPPARRAGAGHLALGTAAGARDRRPRPAECARLLAQGAGQALRRRTRARPGAPQPADAPQAHAQAFAGAGLRGHGCRGQGQCHPSRDARAGRALLPGRAGGRAHRRGARTALPLALLAPHACRRQGRDLRPLVVRPRAGGARRGLLRRG